MRGRFREICAGINIDLGTAAAFREQWQQESNFGKGTPNMESDSTLLPIILKTDQAPGDALVMTSAIYSLSRMYPNTYRIGVISPYPEIFKYNPDITPIEEMPNASALIHMHYPAIHASNTRGITFMQGYCEFLGKALDIDLPLLTNRPHLYFDEAVPPKYRQTPYWVICSGGKLDFTNKLWGFYNYQAVVFRLKEKLDFIQVGEKTSEHPHLIGTYDIVGQTGLRELFDVIRGAVGVLCGVSLPMHIAAALEKPAIVIAGG